MNWKTVAILFSIAVYLYLLIPEWVDLSPWNDVSTSTPDQKLSGSLVNAVPFALIIAGFLLNLLWLKLLGIGTLLAVLGVHLAYFWKPYFWGASESHLAQYARLFGGTYKFLPPRGSNPIPDAHYVTYHVLMLIDLIVAIVALASGQGQQR
jgi:hypothetical protein